MDKTVGIFGQNEIRDKITEFNKNEGRAKIIGPQMNFSKGTLVLEVQIDNKTPNYEVPYKYINE